MKVKRNPGVVIVGYVASVLLVLFLWHTPALLAVALFGISALMLFLLKKKEFVVVYILAALFGPFTESLAIHKGVWRYEISNFFGVPVWLPFLWGAASIVIAYSYNALARHGDKK
ncbi:MAG: hypothetical protein V4437_02435 [Patescibacteria group bacterium]